MYFCATTSVTADQCSLVCFCASPLWASKPYLGTAAGGSAIVDEERQGGGGGLRPDLATRQLRFQFGQVHHEPDGLAAVGLPDEVTQWVAFGRGGGNVAEDGDLEAVVDQLLQHHARHA